MLSRKYRINTEKFPEVTRGRVFQNDYLRVVIKFNDQLENTKFAVIVPNKVAKTAVKRNLLRRRVYSLLDKCKNNSPKAFICVYPKKLETTASDLKKSIEDLICLKK